MRWLNFITLNCVAPILNLHEVSDAGAGEGLMQLHPIRDTELIACGKANTWLNGAYSPSPVVVDNGTVTPAILVHGILRALQAQGFKIRLHSYQLGLDSAPDFTGSLLDDIVVHHCPLGSESELMAKVLVPELKRQARCQEAHLIAESGIGGTTFATLWLRRWVDNQLWLSGSTKAQSKLAIKKRVVEALMDQTVDLPMTATAFTDSIEYSDPMQRACCALLATDLQELHFAGGAMIFAPIIAMNNSILAKQLQVSTTRWVLDSQHAQTVVDALPKHCRLSMPKVSFKASRFEGIRMYEKGYVIEGCGLGACLVFAEQQGISERSLVASLDNAVATWYE